MAIPTPAPRGARRAAGALRRRARTLVAATLLAAGLAAAPSAHAATLNATPSNLGSVFASAQAGDTILLAAGSYGTFYGGTKSNVTLRPASGVARSDVRIGLDFRSASGITVDGVSVTGATISGSGTRNLTIRNSDFVGNARAIIRTKEFSNANVLLDGNRHVGQNVCSGCYDARVHLPERNEYGASGVTIRNSLFQGGSADGIQNGSNGTVIENNEFRDLNQDAAGSTGAHVDAIQLYGSKNTVIRGNFFWACSQCIGIWDGAEAETITDNVIVGHGYPWPLALWGDKGGSRIVHNTIYHHTADGSSCEYGKAQCGVISLGTKSGSAGPTVLKDNIATAYCICSGSQVLSEENYNLFTGGSGSGNLGSGAFDVRGFPTYVGGARPTTYEGFALAPGSLGKGAASDGTDRGARINASQPSPQPTPEPSPEPSPEPTPEPTPTPSDTPADAVWTTPSNVRVGRTVTLDGTRSKGDAPIACTWRFENADGSILWDTATGCRLAKAFTSSGRKYVRLVVRDADGDTDALRRSFWVSR